MATIFDLPLEEIARSHIDAFLDSKLPEAERHEYKIEWEAGKIGEVICAFANSSGGIVLVGVTDSKGQPPYSIVGIEQHERTIWEDQARSIASSMTPTLRVEAKAIDIADRRIVVLIRVLASNARPHAYRDRVMIRLGHETRAASLQMIEQLIRNRDAIQTGQTLLSDLRNNFPSHASTYRKTSIADTYAEPPIFLDLGADNLLGAIAQACIGEAAVASPRPRSVHVTRRDAPGNNDYIEIDHNLSLVRYSSWLRNDDERLDNAFMIGPTPHMIALSLAASLRVREQFQRSLLADVAFDQNVEVGKPLADVHPWNHFLGITPDQRAPGGPPVHEDRSIDLSSHLDRVRFIADATNLSARACGLSGGKEFLEKMAVGCWESALSIVDFAISNFRRATARRQ